ncbi:universal stress protein [Caloranaerobacter azorensis]|uniref:Universal stress protein UspA n=1 Tax=Caloranaerobacter azorensis TaxID=116090 RepID=A0A6P1YCV2_9FIRM|nr:universal stress protein [Caloranaerobacter azorensis]QIB26628.1 universal stress protein UspA [Caloranaerobacter azorensis]
MSSGKNIMVCVTQQKTCERLIMEGYNAVKSDDDKLFVIHVVNEKDKFLNNSSDGEALEYLFNVSKKVGADLTVLRSKDVVKAMADFAKKHNITNIIMGTSPDSDDLKDHKIAMELKHMLPFVDFAII